MSWALQRRLRCSRPLKSALNSYLRISVRNFSALGPHDSVELTYIPTIPHNGNTTDNPLVILHGLFGSKRNWQSTCKSLHRHMPDRPIYALDLRNHGSSPHATPMTYEAMALDVHKFVQAKKLKGMTLLGHSMGGKVAMAYALSLKNSSSAADTLSKLIVADIAPSHGNLSAEFIQYISLMQEIEALAPGAIKTRSDADKHLASHEPDISVRQFLLTNLHLPPLLRHKRDSMNGPDDDHPKPKFIIPLDIIEKAVPALGAFPYEYNKEKNTASTTWDGPTLAIKGTKSAYINHNNLPVMRAFFPNMRLEELDAGHWVHAEKPAEFRKLVVDFMNE